MAFRERFEILLLAGAVAATRLLTRSHYLYDIDSVNFALGIEHFDPRVHQPHPPGYFLYICLGRLFNFVFHDVNLALVILSVLASCGVAILTYKLAFEWFGIREARFAGLLFLLSPLAWFHGTVALTYSVEAFFSALVGYLCWRVSCGSAAFIVPAGLALGISAGVRPSSLLFLAPLFLFSLRSTSHKRKLAGTAALVLAIAAWFLPMISASGGFAAYFGALFSLWQAVPAKETVFNSSPATSIARACTIVFIYFLCFGAASLAPLGAKFRSAPADSRKKIFTLVWIAPGLCFFTFIFLKFVNSGYLLLLSPPACIWLGSWASEWYGNARGRKQWKLALVAVCAMANIVIFLASPFYCSYRSVRRFETQLRAIQTTLPQVGPAGETVIVGFDSHFLGYRHAGYYLPGYLTVEYPQVNLKEGTRIFAMRGRNTHLLPELQVSSYSRFVLFPLPDGEAAYRDCIQNMRKRLPIRSLRTVRVGDREFITGPVSNLSLLFPDSGPAPQRGVYTLLHSGMPAVNSRAHQPGE